MSNGSHSKVKFLKFFHKTAVLFQKWSLKVFLLCHSFPKHIWNMHAVFFLFGMSLNRVEMLVYFESLFYSDLSLDNICKMFSELWLQFSSDSLWYLNFAKKCNDYYQMQKRKKKLILFLIFNLKSVAIILYVLHLYFCRKLIGWLFFGFLSCGVVLISPQNKSILYTIEEEHNKRVDWFLNGIF